MMSINSSLNLEFKMLRIKHQILIYKRYELLLNLDKEKNSAEIIKLKNKIIELENKRLNLTNEY